MPRLAGSSSQRLFCILLASALGCGPPVDQLQHCQSDSDCPTGQICASDSTCWNPNSAYNGPPVTAPDSGATSPHDAGAPDSGTPRDAGSPVDAGAPQDAGPSGDGGGPQDAGVIDNGPPIWAQILVLPNQTKLSWTPGAASAEFWLTITQPAGQGWTTLEVSGDSYTDTGISPGSERTYQLQTESLPVYNSVAETVGSALPAPTVSWQDETSVLVLSDSGCSYTYTVLRGVDGQPLVPIQLDDCADTNVSVGHTYQYALQEQSGVITYQSASIETQAPAPITDFTAVPDNMNPGGVVLEWNGGLQLNDQLFESTTGSTGFLQVWSGNSQPAYATCPLGGTCLFYLVSTYSDGAVESQSPTISFEAPPAAPLDFAIQPGPLPWGFTLTWQPGAGAPDGYAIIGTETYSNLGAPIGPVVVTEPSYSINLALPYTAERFAVQAMRGSLAGGTTQFLTAEVEAPASLYNLQGSQPCLYISDALENLDQTFVAPVGGALQVIELQDTRDGTASQPVYVDLLTGPASSTTVDMGIEDGVVTATSLSGTMVEGGLLVSAGETLTLRIPSSSYSLCATLDGPFDGGTLSSGGVVQGGLELVFAAWIEPASELSAPALTASAETSAAYLSWSASPGATSYQLERGSDGGPLSALATTTETWALDTAVDPAGNYDYQVIAVGADGGSAASNVANIQLDGSQLAAAQVDGLEVIDLPPMQSVGQSFTVSVGGMLDFIEVPTLVSYGGAATLSLSDASGNLLASDLQYGPTFASVVPIPSSWLPGSVAFSFADAGVRLLEGEVLQLTLTVAPGDISSTSYTRASSSDVYDGGTMFLNGGAVPGQDLDFKVVVR